MKYLKQFLIIILITFIGECLKSFIPLPIPASIYGMVILFVCLATGVLKLESIKDVSKFLIEIMPIMFIPAAVGLMTSWDVISPIILPVCMVLFITIITVMAVSGRISQYIIRRDRRAGEKSE